MQPEFENLFFGLRPFTLRESILDGCRVRIAELRNQTLIGGKLHLRP